MSILSEIVANKRQEIDQYPAIDVPRVSQGHFAKAFEQFGIIAELKSASPSEGIILQPYQPERIAREYEQGGAAAISVLTDERYFKGSFVHLQKVRQTTNLPLLCKDFIIDVKQVHYARAHGADACLLIAAALDDAKMKELKEEIEALNMTALIEIHSHEELERVLSLKPTMIAINNRNLHDFSIDRTFTDRLCQNIPAEVITISASGVTDASHIKQLPRSIKGALVGTSLMRAQNRVQQLRNLLA